jgi:hypothetical protein
VLFALPLSFTVNAAIIHWELDSSSYIYTDGYVKGGFDFNTDTYEINNITAEIFSNYGTSCLQCTLYDDDATTFYHFAPGTQTYVEFSKMLYTDNVLDREFYFSVSANNIDGIISPFDLNTPGTYSGLSFKERGYLRLNDPLDPSIFSQDDCPQCAVAIGTMVAVPEPETYLLLLTGLGMIGWRVKGRSKTTIKRISVKISLLN